MRSRWGWAARAAGGTAVLVGTWAALQQPALQRLDVRVGDALRRSGSDRTDRLVTWTTDLGSLYAVLGTGAALAVMGRGDAAKDTLGVGTVAWVLAQSNKRAVGRQRPYETDGVRRLIRPPTGSSFPSGHAAVGMAVMATAAERAYDRPRANLLRALGAYVGLSRVYVGVHYPSDVIGGAGLGLLIAGLWRGPVAVAGRGGVAFGVGTGRRLAPPLVRAAALLLLGSRLGRIGRRTPAPGRLAA